MTATPYAIHTQCCTSNNLGLEIYFFCQFHILLNFSRGCFSDSVRGNKLGVTFKICILLLFFLSPSYCVKCVCKTSLWPQAPSQLNFLCACSTGNPCVFLRCLRPFFRCKAHGVYERYIQWNNVEGIYLFSFTWRHLDFLKFYLCYQFLLIGWKSCGF